MTVWTEVKKKYLKQNERHVLWNENTWKKKKNSSAETNTACVVCLSAPSAACGPPEKIVLKWETSDIIFIGCVH